MRTGWEAKGSRKEEIALLKERIEAIRRQLALIDRAIERLSLPSRGRVVLRAKVNEERCTGCGLCAQVCPQGAIQIGETARVDGARCAGCGLCLDACPQGAITLSP